MRLKRGDRIRLKVRTMLGWKGEGIVEEQVGDSVRFKRADDVDAGEGRCYAWRHEVSRIANASGHGRGLPRTVNPNMGRCQAGDMPVEEME